ncbi:hypothetical protein JMJ77_0012998, partial [Colletotrichum scovillei]
VIRSQAQKGEPRCGCGTRQLQQVSKYSTWHAKAAPRGGLQLAFAPHHAAMPCLAYHHCTDTA